jgi:hypothetical protein
MVWSWRIQPGLAEVKLNFDGSVKVGDGTAEAGMVLRHENGQIIFSDCCQLFNRIDPSVS